MEIGEITDEVRELAVKWMNEVSALTPERDREWNGEETAWDDVRGGDLPLDKVREARGMTRGGTTFMRRRLPWRPSGFCSAERRPNGEMGE